MHFSTPLVLSSLFSLSIALPQLKGLEESRPGRLPVSYGETIFRTYGMKAGKGVAKAEDSEPFTIKAYNSEYPDIHMEDIVASNGKFFIGNMTGSVCPRGVRDCPVGNVTALQTTKEGYAYLDVVNKTQVVYVDAQSGLRFNPPGVQAGQDSRNATFSLTTNPIPAPPAFSALKFSGVGRSTGYLACPIAPVTEVWEVFVSTNNLIEDGDSWVPSGDVSDCIGFDAFASNYTSPIAAAYQYV